MTIPSDVHIDIHKLCLDHGTDRPRFDTSTSSATWGPKPHLTQWCWAKHRQRLCALGAEWCSMWSQRNAGGTQQSLSAADVGFVCFSCKKWGPDESRRLGKYCTSFCYIFPYALGTSTRHTSNKQPQYKAFRYPPLEHASYAGKQLRQNGPGVNVYSNLIHASLHQMRLCSLVSFPKSRYGSSAIIRLCFNTC